jgi:two-component system CheB/CheR fusion protein
MDMENATMVMAFLYPSFCKFRGQEWEATRQGPQARPGIEEVTMPAKREEIRPKKGGSTTGATKGKKKKASAKKVPAKNESAKKSPPPLQKVGSATVPTEERSFPIVGMGASAGGLEAFEQFFKNMPPDSGMAFILVPHLDPTHTSIMPDLLKKYTNMKVIQAEDGVKVQPDSVYIIPPNKDMAILNGTLQLMEPTEARDQRLPIDYFLRSLAKDQKEKAVSIILSGTGTDGTLGLRTIKGELGMAMVQNLDSAKYDGMPRSAIETGLVDYILPPEEMPNQLTRYAKRANLAVAPKVIPGEGKTPDALQKIFVLLRSYSGHDFSSYKQNTICRRIERRMNVHQIDNISNYVRYLQQNPHEGGILFKELLIGVTNFFRDPEAFEVLKQNVFPQLLKDKPEDYSIRVWVPGCSSGEEAYSIAMILRECMDDLNRHFIVQVFGTDIDGDAIDTARIGAYPASISADVSPDRLKRFFMREDNLYRIKKEIRELVIFAPQNVIKDPPFTKLDLISCRNLLIYLGQESQKKLLPLFHYSLKPGGILFLGTSETIGRYVDLFSVGDKKWKFYKRTDSAHSVQAMVEFPAGPARDEGPGVLIKEPTTSSTSQLVEKILLEDYAPPCVIINNKGDIVYIHGRTGKYLEPAPGEAHLNIQDMAREGLKLELPTAIRKAVSRKSDVTYEGLRVKDNGGYQLVNLTVRPVREPEPIRGLLMVLFEDVLPPRRPDKTKTRGGSSRKADKRVEDLEQELKFTKESLQTTIEELETSNEELKSTNEELQSTNEELQSTNEEMETSKEELQSLNEELVTVNSELQGKIDELSRANDDMRNLLESTEIATIFLDNDLRIIRFTKHATKVINLIPTDVGRPVSHIASNFKFGNLTKDAEEVLKTLVFSEKEVQAEDGHWYFTRIMPYRTVDNLIDGVVVTFVDIHAQKIAQEKIEKSKQVVQDTLDYVENILDTVREPLLVLDSDLQVVSASRSFYGTFQVKPEETEKKFIWELGNRQWEIPRLRELLEEVIPKSNVFDDFEVDHKFPKIGHKKMLLNARKIYREGTDTELILLAIEDLTPKEKIDL